ncbi:ParB/RepB/Spo0J family partition protein [Deinococcus cavernae]|uniref:ParB/RepB/Spo0J family partition protein n=1 Tax=Deinococcus cavernae TaxID=2320857 RepID=A0A418VFM5_9DEIO|nr:ParB/RepB/Spo0J family partition protein [Deinococcus cavernae]RJF74877.1 ParB/RepB/Spo0J family partition protein [Deinococcus cavernae]
MARKRPAMPGNLSVLLGETTAMSKAPAAETTLPVAALSAGRAQPRREFDEARLQDLAQSIQAQGVLQPLLVRPVAGGHEIVAGERRWRAAQLAGLTEVPVVIRDLTDREARQVALIENLQREDLNTVDEVDAKLELVAAALNLTRDEARTRLMQMLREEPGDDHAALDALFGPLGERWPSFASNKLRILKWPAPILDAVRSGLPYTIGAVIVPAPAEQHPHLIEFAQAGASLKEVRAEVKRLAVQPAPRSQAALVGRVLTSNRWLGKLDARQQKVVDAWLSKMPDVVRQALDD